MKKLLFAISALLLVSLNFTVTLGQASKNKPFNYQIAWNEVTKYENESLPKSADSIANIIHTKALMDKNSDEAAKSLIYTLKNRREYTEDSWNEIYIALCNEGKKTWEPYNQIIHSYIAELVAEYAMENQWKIRTKKTPGDSLKLNELIREQILDIINTNTVISLQNETLLKSISIKEFPQIIDKGNQKSNLRTNLWEILAHAAIMRYDNCNEFGTVGEDDELYIDSTYFCLSEKFAKIDLPKNTKSPLTSSINIWQAITNHRLALKEDKEALLNNDIERILWLSNHYYAPNKDSLVYRYMKEIESLSKGLSLSSKAAYYKAMAYKEISIFDNKYDLIKTVEYLETGAKNYPQSIGGKMCLNEIAAIKQPALQISSEEVYYPNKEGIIKLEAKNCEKLYVYYIKLEKQNKYSKEIIEADSVIALLNKESKSIDTSITLPITNDYQYHTYTLSTPKLQPGKYLMVVSPQHKKNIKQTNFSYKTITTTSLGVASKTINSNLEVNVFDRQTGYPLANTEVIPYEITYQNGIHRNVIFPDTKFITNNSGLVTIPLNDNRPDRIELNVTTPTENYWVNLGYQNHYRYQGYNNNKLYILTDRKIYRPGQTVQFKAIYINSNNGENKTLSNSKVNIALRDVNGNELQKLELTTNQFGSCSGMFKIPTNVLTGDWAITSQNGSNTFMVEAYKRPKFFIELNPPTNAYKAGDTIEVKGNATSFSGTALSNAEVKYTITKSLNNWPYYRHQRDKNLIEIAIGTIKLDNLGNFTIKFTSPKTAKNTPYNCMVATSITDINGETQTKDLDIFIDNKSEILSVDAPNSVNIDVQKNIIINPQIKNLAEKPLTGKGTYKVYFLSPNDTIKLNAYWTKPEFDLSANQIAKKYNYQNNQYKQTIIESGIWNSQDEKAIILGQKKLLNPGVIKIEICYKNDTINKQIELETYKAIDFSPTDKPLTTALTTTKDSTTIIVASVLKNLTTNITIMASNQFIIDTTLTLSKQQVAFSVANNKYIGNDISVEVWGAQNNRFYNKTEEITIEDTTKQITITAETFRTKLTPGTPETIKLKIKSNSLKPDSFEIAATMYDASLDKLVSNQWSIYNYRNYRVYKPSIQTDGFSLNYDQTYYGLAIKHYEINEKFPSLKWLTLWRNGKIQIDEPEEVFCMVESPAKNMAVGRVDYDKGTDDVEAPIQNKIDTPNNKNEVAIRRNLEETAFFYPHLSSDNKGEVIINYTTPDNLTKWKFMALAHNQQANWKTIEKYAQTTKELMVVPEVPRFLREGDEQEIACKIVNLTNSKINSTVTIELLDAITKQPLKMVISNLNISSAVNENSSEVVKWKIKVGNESQAVILRIKATSGNHSDGEEHYIPVLPNRIMVSESLPINLLKAGKTTHHFTSLENNKNAQHYKLTFKYTQNAAWEALKALPYLMEYPHECSEQLFSRLFSYAVGIHIINTYPNIKQALEYWKLSDEQSQSKLISPLEQNETIQSILLEETPWLQAGQDETANRRRILKLLDENFTNEQIRLAIAKLQELQLHGGGFTWFRGMGEDTYMTRHIIIGFGILKKMNANIINEPRVVQIINSGIENLEQQTKEAWQNISKDSIKTELNANHIHLLYALSFYDNNSMDSSTRQAHQELTKLLVNKKTWQTVTEQAMATQLFSRLNLNDLVKKQLASLNEKAIKKDAYTVYYRQGNSWDWSDNHIETQTSVLDCLNEVSPQNSNIAAMQNYLITQKRTQSWPTTKNTMLAINSLLSSPNLFSNSTTNDIIKIGKYTIGKSTSDQKEMVAGTITKQWYNSEIDNSMGKIIIAKTSQTPSWASATWQYYTPISSIKATTGSNTISKKLFVQKQTSTGNILLPISETEIPKGDKIVVQLNINATQAMDYVHIKDLRSSLTEPMEIFSQYIYQNNLGYYRSGTDAAMNFFIGHLPKGNHTIEYELVASGSGISTNGFATMQCIYAPEFESRSENTILHVK